jgi:hypothetical protein
MAEFGNLMMMMMMMMMMMSVTFDVLWAGAGAPQSASCCTQCSLKRRACIPSSVH